MSPTPIPASAYSIDVTDADFETTVLQRSLDVPVLLDCWAAWCGPCRSLKPVLEKLAEAYQGRFVLAKLDTDANPQVAALLGLRSIPLVVLFKDGQPVDQFMGALPEGQVRAFLDAHLKPPTAAEQARRAALQAAPDEAEPLLRRALELAPDDAELLTALAERLEASRPDEARALVEGIPEPLRDDAQRALLARLDLAAQRPTGDETALRARLAADARDHPARFDLAALLAHRGDFAAAFDELLEVVLRDKGEQREAARARMVEWFGLCRDAAVVDRARRRLSMYLN